MSAFLPPAARSAVIGRLRAGGCVFAEDEAALLIEAAHTPNELTAMIDRRVSGIPLEYILGWAEFCGLRVAVDPGVFVPRQRTEFLVSRAVALAHSHAVVLDICCGSGAVGLAIASAGEQIELHAVDIDATSVQCARRNISAAGGRAYVGDLFEPLPVTLRGRVDLVVANVPYVPTDSIRLLPPEARNHEPRVALDGGPDGLDVLRLVAEQAASWLAPGGSLLIETSPAQAPQALDAFTRGGMMASVASSNEHNATLAIGALTTG